MKKKSHNFSQINSSINSSQKILKNDLANFKSDNLKGDNLKGDNSKSDLGQKFSIANIEIKAGSRKRIDIDMGSIYDFTEVKMPIEVLRGSKNGPTIFICSTIHGDEIIGIEIVRRVLAKLDVKNLSGTVIAIPIVNVFGFNDRSRYLPDRRDLNRCFPGLKNGSLASQLAFKFMQEIVLKSDFGIDIHTGAYHRTNFPQIRTDIENSQNLALAKAFNAPAIVNSNLRDGSLREATSQAKIPMVLFEAGEALRFDEQSVEIGVNGIFGVLEEISMLKKSPRILRKNIFLARSTSWIRASQSGICIPKIKLGSMVKKGQIIAEISNPFGDNKTLVKAVENGMVIGSSVLPLVNKGDALFHIGYEVDQKNNVISENNLGIDTLNIKHY
jgi:predicted deacylase